MPINQLQAFKSEWDWNMQILNSSLRYLETVQTPAPPQYVETAAQAWEKTIQQLKNLNRKLQQLEKKCTN